MSNSCFTFALGKSLPGTHLVYLYGELDASTSVGLSDALCSVGHSTVIADRSGLGFIDASGISQLVRARQFLRSTGNDLVVRGANRTTRRVFGILKLSDMLEESENPKLKPAA